MLLKIPKEKVVTYKEMARACKTSPRAIGRIMINNPDPINYPCYKVVSSNGDLRGYRVMEVWEEKRSFWRKTE